MDEKLLFGLKSQKQWEMFKKWWECVKKSEKLSNATNEEEPDG